MPRVLTIAAALSIGSWSVAVGQQEGPYSRSWAKNVPAEWVLMEDYPEPCRDKMHEVDGLLVAQGASADRYLMATSSTVGPTRRQAVYLVNLGGQHLAILFGWDVGGTLCQMGSLDGTNVGQYAR